VVEITAEYITIITATFAAFSAVVSAFAALKANSTAKIALKFQRQLEENQQQLMKNEFLLKNYQTLIATFAQIEAIAKDGWSQERSSLLEEMSKKLTLNCAIVKSLNREIGSMIQQWERSIDSDGNSIPRIITMTLGHTGSIINDKYDKFFTRKSDELYKIQEKIFSLITQKIV